MIPCKKKPLILPDTTYHYHLNNVLISRGNLMNEKNSQSLQEEHTFDITLQLEYLLFLPNS